MTELERLRERLDLLFLDALLVFTPQGRGEIDVRQDFGWALKAFEDAVRADERAKIVDSTTSTAGGKGYRCESQG